MLFRKKLFVLFWAVLCIGLSGCTPGTGDFGQNGTDTSARIEQTKTETARSMAESAEEGSTREVEGVVREPGETVALHAEQENPDTEPVLSGKVICLDPGHGITSESEQEKMSPLSDETKPAYVSGASGECQTEEELNLAVAELVKERLEELGAEVYMTRTENEATVSNLERAEMANEREADLCVRIHADGTEDSSAHGFSVLVPAGEYLGTPSIVEPSREAAVAVEESLAESTGAKDRGIVEREDLTGFNWSEVPVILVEMGFLSNPEEDEKMATVSYREKLADGISGGVEKWLTQD